MDPATEAELGTGFRIGDVLVAWGTTLGAATALPGLTRLAVPYPAANQAVFRCDARFGFRTLSASLTAPSGDRPVLTATYLIDARDEAAGAVVGRLAATLGRPDRVGAYPEAAGVWSMVTETAEWRRGDITLSVSVFGGERPEDGGRSIAMIWHSWSEARAALPYLDAWRQRSAALARYAARRDATETFRLDLEQMHDDRAARRAVHHALYRPELLDTPAELAAAIPPTGFALWSSRRDAIWCLSTRWTSAAFDFGATVAASHIEIKPAKGGGYAEIAVGSWSARACYPSVEVARAARTIAAIEGVRMEHHEGYDA